MEIIFLLYINIHFFLYIIFLLQSEFQEPRIEDISWKKKLWLVKLELFQQMPKKQKWKSLETFLPE